MTLNPNPKFTAKKHQARLERERIQNRWLLISAVVVLVLVLGVIGYGILDKNVLAERRPVAKVGNESITTKDFQVFVRYQRLQNIQRYEQNVQMMQYFGNDPNTAGYFQNMLTQAQQTLANTQQFGSDVLDQMVDNLIIEQEAKKRGITVTDEEVQSDIQAAFGFFPKGTPTSAPVTTEMPLPTLSAEQLALVTLTPTATTAPAATEEATATPAAAGATPTALFTVTPQPTPTAYTQEGYESQKTMFLTRVGEVGFTQAELNSMFRYNLFRKKLQEQIAADVAGSKEQVWARHILVKDEETAKKVLERLQKGEDWSVLASELSEDTSNKDQGGDLGWFGKGAMVPEFETAAFALTKIGEISQPVKTSFGYHIIQLLGREERPLTADELSQAKDQKFSEWLTEARKTAQVVKYDRWKSVVPTTPELPADQLQQIPVQQQPATDTPQ